MRERRGELAVLIAMGVLVIVASVLSIRREEERLDISGSTRAAGGTGALALYLWLDGLGYPVQRLERGLFGLGAEEEVLWVITPNFFPGISPSEAEEVEEWVRDGGTLVWVESFPTSALFEVLEVETEAELFDEAFSVRPTVPWLRHPEASYPASFSFELPRGATPLLAGEDGSVGGLRMALGDGEVWLFSTAEPFTNEGLKEEANSALVQGLLEQLPPAASLTFDEFHHGFTGTGEARSLTREARRAPWGWAIYYAAGVVALWLLLRGRKFGRPLPLPGEHLRREAGEYARSMAWLYRRARLRQPVLRYHRDRLVRRLTERYRLPLFDNDDAFASAVARARSDVDEAALRSHLQALRRADISESQLVALARVNDEWLAKLRVDDRRPTDDR
ncbi:MAG TPA: DUF4350 domain-containing protein [Ardenticatenaceae bacterium]